MHQGHYDRATALCEEALSLGRELGNKTIISLQLGHLGIMARYVGDYERATALQNESLALCRELGDSAGIAFVLRNLGKVALHQNDSERAEVYFRESLTLSRETGHRWLSEEGLEGFAAVASATGHYERAARLLGAGENLREVLSWHPSPPNQADYDECRASTRAALGDTAFSVARAEGRAMTLEQAVEFALAPTEAPKRKREEPNKSAIGKRTGLLAPRERAVAALIVDGMTNREIAAKLSITESTAETHAQHILNKLGFNSRTQIAAWAVSHGLRSTSSSPFILPPDR